MNLIKLLSVIIIILFTSSCEVSTNVSNRSGTLDDDYVEEPLSARSIKFAPALEISNDFINSIQSGNYDYIYSELISDGFKEELSKEEFMEMLNTIINLAGQIKMYKQQQWGFFTIKEDGNEYIGSVKIVEHENGILKYLFVFENDGVFKTLVGFNVKDRTEVTPPGIY